MKRLVATLDGNDEALLPPNAPDGSGIGVNYADARIKSLNAALDDGRVVSCKRKGLKIQLKIGDAAGEGLMRRIAHGPDPRDILRRALEEAAEAAGAAYIEQDGAAYLDIQE